MRTPSGVIESDGVFAKRSNHNRAEMINLVGNIGDV